MLIFVNKWLMKNRFWYLKILFTFLKLFLAFSKFSNHGVSWVVLQTRGGRGSVHAEGSLIQISLLTLKRGVSCPILLSLDDSQDSGAVSPRRVLAVHSADEFGQKPASFDSSFQRILRKKRSGPTSACPSCQTGTQTITSPPPATPPTYLLQNWTVTRDIGRQGETTKYWFMRKVCV